MGLRLVLFHLITAMVAVNLIFAQGFGPPEFFDLPFGNNSNNNSSNNNSTNQTGPSPGPGPWRPRPPFGPGPGPRPRPPFGPGPGSRPRPQRPSRPGFGPRQKRSPEPQEEQRLFFGSRVSCNSTTQGGTTCPACRQVLACYPNNVGRLRTCRGFARYCNNGRCSIFPGEQCTNSTG